MLQQEQLQRMESSAVLFEKALKALAHTVHTLCRNTKAYQTCPFADNKVVSAADCAKCTHKEISHDLAAKAS